MKLPKPDLDTATKLREFDVWVTPALGELRDTPQFKAELAGVAETFELLGRATGEFADPAGCSPSVIAAAVAAHANGQAGSKAEQTFSRLASVLFLATGKSDNNAKCQLPLYLRDQVRLPSFPTPVARRNQAVTEAGIPNKLPAKVYMKAVVALRETPQRQSVMLDHYLAFLLNDPVYVSQLWCLGNSYFALKRFGRQNDFLSPLVAFKVRGSVAATGGHEPERLLRDRLIEWGLRAGIDYNSSDVTLAALATILSKSDSSSSILVKSKKKRQKAPADATKPKKIKSRAYDFILPFRTPGVFRRVCVQSQFYAGDAGSVSHKNVDQTATARTALRKLIPDAVLMEYVDGAGYFSSLNGDLEKLFDMDGTEFCQVRSAPVRLRRELQHAGFLTPLELQQATYRTVVPTREAVSQVFRAEGYADAEFGRCLADAMDRGLLIEQDGRLAPRAADVDLVRRYLLLDVAATAGTTPSVASTTGAGMLMIPGYGPFHGIKLDDLVQTAGRLAPGLAGDIGQSRLLMADLRWLDEQKMAIL